MEDQARYGVRVPESLVKDGVVERPRHTDIVYLLPGGHNRYIKDMNAYCDYLESRFEDVIENYVKIEKMITDLEKSKNTL